MRFAVDAQGQAHDVIAPTEACLPHTMRENQHAIFARLVFSRAEAAPQHGLHPEGIDKVAGHRHRCDEFGWFAGGSQTCLKIPTTGDRIITRACLLKLLPLRQGRVPPRVLRSHPVNGVQLFAVLIRQGLEHNPVHQAEHCGVGSNT